MSRVGKKPITIPAGVTVNISGGGAAVRVHDLRTLRQALSDPDAGLHWQVELQLPNRPLTAHAELRWCAIREEHYDGKRLPLLYRLMSVEGGAGRTLAYIAPAEGTDIAGKLGTIVGVVGTREGAAGLRAQVITPRRIDVLNP